MNYRRRALVGYIAAGFTAICTIACMTLTAIAAQQTGDPSAIVALTWWTLALFIVAALSGIVVAEYWPTRYERQHAVTVAQRPVDATNRLIRLIDPHRNR